MATMCVVQAAMRVLAADRESCGLMMAYSWVVLIIEEMDARLVSSHSVQSD